MPITRRSTIVKKLLGTHEFDDLPLHHYATSTILLGAQDTIGKMNQIIVILFY
jgi:hypothetical protein